MNYIVSSLRSESLSNLIKSGRRTTSPLVLFLIALLLFPCITSKGQTSTTSATSLHESATVRGRVVDGLGAVVRSATVILRNLNTGFERSTTTDLDGKFAFTGSRGEHYRVTVSANGFARATTEVEVDSQELVLEVEPLPLSVQTVVVSGSRQEELRESLNTRVEVLTRSQIRDTGYETVAETLREVPGVMTRRGSETAGAAGEQIQGIDSRQVLVLMDGQPLIGARGIKSGILNLDRQSVGRLERVEVVKGAASALYGSDAIGGVINLITREPESPLEVSLTTSGGSFGAFDTRGELGFVHDRTSGFFTVERHKNNGFDLTPTTFDTTGSGFHRYDLYGKLRFQLTPTLQLTTFANSYWNNSSGKVVGEEGNQFNSTDDESQNYGASLDWQLDARTNLQTRGYFARYDEISRGVLAPPRNTALPDGNLFQRYGKVDATLTRVFGERQLLQVGGEWTTDRYRGINRIRSTAGERADIRTLWAQDRIGLDRFTITLGGRYDNHSLFGSAFSPKAGINVRLTDNLNLRGSYGRGFRAPDLGQLYYRFLNPTNLYQVIGNPRLKPEYANSYQFGGEYSAQRGRYRFGINVFRNDVENLIESVSLGFITSTAQLNAILASEGIDPSFNPVLNRLLFFYKNIRNVRTQGLEADADFVLPRGFATGVAYTFLKAQDETARLPLTNRNRHQGFVRAAWTNPRIGLRLNLRGSLYSSWIASRTTVAGVPTEIRAPRFALWDFYAAQRLLRNDKNALEVFGAIDNLADSRDPNTGLFSSAGAPLAIYRAEQGRTFRIGLRYSFAGGTK